MSEENVEGESENASEVNASAASGSTVEEEAQSLRLVLEELLHSQGRRSEDFRYAWSDEEVLAKLIMIVSQHSSEVLDIALRMAVDAQWDQQNDDVSYTGRFPLHLAIDSNAPFEIIRWLLENDPTKDSVSHKDKWGDLPLHTACSRKNYTQVVKLLLDADPTKETVLVPRVDGSLPIHTACRYNAPAEVFNALLECDPSPTARKTTLFHPNQYGQLPLHVACRCNLHPISLQVLLEQDLEQRALLIPDGFDRIPLHLAYLHRCPPSSVELLLKGMIQGRCERRGLENWKRDSHEMMKLMGVPERDSDTCDKLTRTMEVLSNFMERVYALELAVWKSSCCRGEQHSTGQLASIADLLQADKEHYRITSGADVIVPRVLSFMDDEPVSILIEEFKNW